MKKLDLIMLIDDDDNFNHLHSIIIEKHGCAKNIVICENGKEALDYINSIDHDDKKPPDLIFLDINMPIMNGWEFLEEYHKLPSENKAKVIMIMLTTSTNPKDIKKANEFMEIRRFYTKPLSFEMLDEVLEKYF